MAPTPGRPGAAASLVGRTLGAYRLTGIVGEGGMGRVYLGEHEVIGRKVAIKVLSAEVAGDADVVARFFTEARAVNDIRHPNIVEVTDFGTFEKQPFIVMEYLEGETLADRLTRVGCLTEAGAVRIVAQVASALGAAHERGLVHRDLKPANILLRAHPDYPDFVKVLDFGIAKLVGGAPGAPHQTQVGAVIGTPAYMSPEQCVGDRNLDHRSDVYSLGVVLYLMVTGRLPFEGDSLGRLIVCHVGEAPPPPASVRPGLSAAMNALILRALEKKPERRFATMRELRQQLAALGEGGAMQVTPPPMLLPPHAPETMAATLVSGAGAPRARPGGNDCGSAGAVGLKPIAGGLGPSEGPKSSVTKESTGERQLGERFVELGRSHLRAGQWSFAPLSVRLARCLEATENPSFSFASVATLVATEPRLASHVITTANTPPFASHTPATTLEQAIGRVGAKGLRAAVVEFALRPLLELRDRVFEETFRRPWPRALAVAIVCQRLCQQAGQDELAGNAYLAGLLHDAGRPLASTKLFEMERQVRAASGRRVLATQTWLEGVEALHRGVGAALARHLRLPEVVAEAVGHADAFDAAAGFSVRNALRLAAALADSNGFPARRGDEAHAVATIEEGRRVLGADVALVARAVQGLKERVTRRA